jgi:hypothetical protein
LRSAFLLGLGGDDLLDLLLLGVHLRLDERDLADALGGHAGLDVELLLLLLDDGLLLGDDGGALAFHLDGGLGDLDLLVHLGERDGALAADAGLLALLHGLLFEALLLLLDGVLAFLHGAVHVLGAEADGFLGLEALASTSCRRASMTLRVSASSLAFTSVMARVCRAVSSSLRRRCSRLAMSASAFSFSICTWCAGNARWRRRVRAG